MKYAQVGPQPRVRIESCWDTVTVAVLLAPCST
jgi:hypothetical protein